jgi:hypothetical protein
LARKPRVLTTALPAPACREATEAPVSPKQQMAPEIPVSQFARIRALVKYGMTVPQVAQVYGVDVGKIERVLQSA